MINRPLPQDPKKPEPTKTEQVKAAVVSVRKTARAERDLVIAAIFLVIGYLMGQF